MFFLLSIVGMYCKNTNKREKSNYKRTRTTWYFSPNMPVMHNYSHTNSFRTFTKIVFILLPRGLYILPLPVFSVPLHCRNENGQRLTSRSTMSPESVANDTRHIASRLRRLNPNREKELK